MRKTREILRLKWCAGRSNREVGLSCKISPSTVATTLYRAKAAGLSWPLPDDLDDAALEAALYPPAPPSGVSRPTPDFPLVYKEVKRKGVTLELLWQEYKAQHPVDGYQYSAFCDGYRRYRNTLDVVMRQEHQAGEKLYVDYAGMTVDLVNPKTGEVTAMVVFVATFGASNYTYVEAQRAADLRNWVGGHTRAFARQFGLRSRCSLRPHRGQVPTCYILCGVSTQGWHYE